MSDRKSARRSQILDAAVEVFASTGFHKSRVSDIARVAQVADGTIYLYFKSKDAILISIFEEKMAEIIEMARRAVASIDDPLEQLRTLARLHMENVETHSRVAKVLQVELRLSNTFMKEYQPVALREYLDLIGSILEDGRARGRIRPEVDTRFIRRAFFGALDEIAMQWVLTPNPNYHLVEVAEQIADVFVRGIRTEAASQEVQP